MSSVTVFGKCPCCGERNLYLNAEGVVVCGTRSSTRCLLADELTAEEVFERLVAGHRNPDGTISCDGHVLLRCAAQALKGRHLAGATEVENVEAMREILAHRCPYAEIHTFEAGRPGPGRHTGVHIGVRAPGARGVLTLLDEKDLDCGESAAFYAGFVAGQLAEQGAKGWPVSPSRMGVKF